jgi:hypothetical protein
LSVSNPGLSIVFTLRIPLSFRTYGTLRFCLSFWSNKSI